MGVGFHLLHSAHANVRDLCPRPSRIPTPMCSGRSCVVVPRGAQQNQRWLLLSGTAAPGAPLVQCQPPRIWTRKNDTLGKSG